MDDQTEVPFTEDDRKKTREAFDAIRAQKAQVRDDLDASLDEPAVPEDAMPCDFCGEPGHSFEDCEKAGELEVELKQSFSYAKQQVKHAALESAIKVVCSPHSPFRTERASADEIVAYAQKFEEFLSG